MKKLINIVVLLISIVFCIAGCGNKNDTVAIEEAIKSSETSKTQSAEESSHMQIVPEEYFIEWENSEAYTEEYFRREYEGTEYDRNVEISSGNIILSGEYANSLPPINNEVELDEVISVIDNEYIINDIWYTLPYSPTYINATETPTLQNILNNTIREGGNSSENVIPVNFLRQMECKDFFYTVIEFNNGYAYAVFGRPIIGGDDNGNPIYSTDDITELKFYGGVYATKSVKYEDFANISVGSSLFDVIAIEPAAEHVLQLHRSYRAVGVPFFKDMHQVMLLEDGLLEIIYEPRIKTEVDYYGSTYYSNESDDMIVSSITYYPDFMYKSSINTNIAGIDKIPSIPIQILPQDYPPAS